MLAGELPWDKPVVDNKEFSDWIENDYYKRTPWCKLENTALSLLRRMLYVDAGQRISLKQVKQSAWYMRTITFETTRNTFSTSQQNQIYLSQPNYATSPIEMQIHDSNDDCTCIESTEHLHSHIQSFSQPISTDNMLLNSQANTQSLSSQMSQVSPFIRLVKRMTRMFVHMSVDQAVNELKRLFQKFMFEYKVHNTVTSHRQRQITVTTIDKRQTPLTFQINIIEMNSLQNDVLVDFRLSKGDGLEFKKIFMNIKASLDNYVCKKYVFMNPSQCCDGH
jgi:serine/threonine-protein kinase Chk1